MGAKIITLFNQKGGAGKTTVSMHIAGTLARRGEKALLVDMDPQGSASIWAACAPDDRPFPATVLSLAHFEGKMHREVRKYVDDYDYLVIDCPPAIHSPVPSSALLVSDLAIIPITPAPVDVWASQTAKELASNAMDTNETLVTRVLCNLFQPRVSLARQVQEELEKDEEFQLLKNYLGNRTAYKECQAIGGTVHSIPGAKSAIHEVESLVDEILDILG